MFKFEWLHLLALLPLPLIFSFFNRKETQTGNSLKLPFFDQLEQINTLSNKTRLINLDQILLWLCWSTLILAAMKPIWIDEQIKLPIKGRDIILSIDLSGSMRQPDFVINNQRVSRLEVVKVAAEQFIKARKYDRIGLILFGDKAYLYAPLTFDKRLILQYLKESQIGLVGQKTAMFDSIVLAIKHFRDNKKLDDEERTLILLTDGANTAGAITLARAVELAKEEKIKIYTIGMGGAAQGFFRQGVDENTLKYIAKETNGLYYSAQDTKSLYNIYNAIDKLEQRNLEDKFYRPQKDLFYYPLIVFLTLLSLLLLRKCK